MYEGHTTHRYESGDLLSVLNQLHTHTFADGRVWLLGFDADFFEHDAFGVRRASGRGRFVDVA